MHSHNLPKRRDHVGRPLSHFSKHISSSHVTIQRRQFRKQKPSKDGPENVVDGDFRSWKTPLEFGYQLGNTLLIHLGDSCLNFPTLILQPVIKWLTTTHRHFCGLIREPKAQPNNNNNHDEQPEQD